MSVIVKLPSGNWRAQIRRKGRYVSSTFRRQRDAEEWALEAERSIDRGLTPRVVHVKDVKTFADIIDLHINDMEEVGKPIRRSKPDHCTRILKDPVFLPFNLGKL
jgi:hypothetical protein